MKATLCQSEVVAEGLFIEVELEGAHCQVEELHPVVWDRQGVQLQACACVCACVVCEEHNNIGAIHVVE